MNKLVEKWYERSKLFRAGVVWAVLFLLVRIVFWYIGQNVGMPSMSAAQTMGTVIMVNTILIGLMVLLAVIGFFVSSNPEPRRRRGDDVTKIADGVWMVKK